MLRDDEFEFEDDEFQWNKKKADDNFKYHHVSFEKARKVFDGCKGIIVPDTRKDYGEDRFNLIGEVVEEEEFYVLVVTHTFRGDKIRIISARAAEPYEKRKYRDPRGRR